MGALEGGEDRVSRVSERADSGLVDAGIGRVGPVNRPDMTSAGDIIEVEAGGGGGADGSGFRPDATEGGDVFGVGADGAGRGEGPVEGGDLAAVGDDEGAVVGDGGKGGGEGVGRWAEGGGEGGVEGGEGGRGGGGAEMVLDAVIGCFVEEFEVGEAAEGGGGEAVGAEEGEEDGEDVRVSVNEDRVVVVRVGSGGEDGEEGVGSARLEGGDGRLEQLSSYVELYAVLRRGRIGIFVRHFSVFSVQLKLKKKKQEIMEWRRRRKRPYDYAS